MLRPVSTALRSRVRPNRTLQRQMHTRRDQHPSNAAVQQDLPEREVEPNPTELLDALPQQEPVDNGPPSPDGPTFASEFYAGVRGYTRALIFGDPPDDYQYQDPAREQWNQDLLNSDLPPTLQRQLRSQNHSQDQSGNHLPPEAGEVMIDRGEKLSEACRSGDRIEAQQAHQDYMIDSIEPFEEGGSSLAPRVLHSLGVLWQGPGILADPDHLMRQPRSLTERLGLGGSGSPPKSDEE